MKQISVILPVYNGIDYLRQSVESVLNQTYFDFELIIVDDCSTDGSYEYLASITDPRIKLTRNKKNQGLFPNLNFLIGQSSAPLIKLWAQDDVMYPVCLETIIRFHQLHPHISFSYSGRDFIDEKDILTGRHQNDPTPDIVDKYLHARIAFYTGSIAGNIANVTLCRNALNKAGMFNERMKISGDFEMWVRLSLIAPIGFIRQNIIQLRDHSQQLSRQERYYYHHMKEDMEAFEILLANIHEKAREEGRYLLRHHKLMFYYTLMIKSFLKGQFKTGFAFLKKLGSFDNLFVLTGNYIRFKILGKKKFVHQPQLDKSHSYNS